MGYYTWGGTRARIEQAHTASYGIYGSVKVTQMLQPQHDLERACRNTIALAMRRLGLKSRVHRRFTSTPPRNDPAHQPAPNTLNQDFTADAPNRKWVLPVR